MAKAYRCDGCGIMYPGEPSYTFQKEDADDILYFDGTLVHRKLKDVRRKWDLCKTCGEKHVDLLTEGMVAYDPDRH